MIFAHTWESVLWKSKTQTRRLVKAQEILSHYMTDTDPNWQACVLTKVDGTMKWTVGNDYAVQPGRGKPTMIYHPNHPCYEVDIIEPGDQHYAYAKDGTWRYQGQGYKQARIRITDIRREDVRCISDEDVKAEGFARAVDFFEVWCSMHDKDIVIQPGSEKTIVSYPRVNQFTVEEHDAIRDILNLRPAHRYDAWTLTFELI